MLNQETTKTTPKTGWSVVSMPLQEGEVALTLTLAELDALKLALSSAIVSDRLSARRLEEDGRRVLLGRCDRRQELLDRINKIDRTGARVSKR